MNLLTTSEAKHKIAEQIASATKNLQVISAFCKIPAIEFIDSKIKYPLQSKKIMVRFLLSDVLNGASDLSLYEYCKTHGWQMYVRFDLHAKTYIFDRKRCILGSANLTSKGMGLNVHGNYELSSFSEIDQQDLCKIDSLFDNAILMTDELFDIMTKEYDAANNVSCTSSNVRWSGEVEQRFNPSINVLFTYDFPATEIPDFNNVNSFDFLELDYVPDKDELLSVFRWSKCFLWLYNFVGRCPNSTSCFGEITANLHNALISDPKPYRKDVKTLLVNLIGWIEALGVEEFVIDVPNHSQRVRIVQSR